MKGRQGEGVRRFGSRVGGEGSDEVCEEVRE